MLLRLSQIYFLRLILALGFLLPLLLPEGGQASVAAEIAELRIEPAGRGGKTHIFKVEAAVTPETRALGLMFRREMAADSGMLFDFGQNQPVSMWMKNTLIPLDMLFIDAEGRVVNIAERTVPGSLAGIASNGPVRFVLEVNGGTAARLGLKPGDRVHHPLIAKGK